jgi:uncharacterized protein YhaN
MEHQEELKENTCYILENLNFRPDENSYVEPWVDHEELKRQAEEEKNRENLEDSQPDKSGKKPAEAKKLSAAEKKKLEEEAKKKAAEDSVDSQERRMQLEKEQFEADRRESIRLAREAEEHFDAKTTFDYLTKLGKNFGSIYVNDAPLACLTTSNSVSELKASRKVMGLHMTETVRRLAQFFLK